MASKRAACLFFLACLTAPTALAQQVQVGQDASRATVECDSVPVYAAMSKDSRVVKHLKKGERVTVDLEIQGSDGLWCAVVEAGNSARTGFVPAGCLGRQPPPSETWTASAPIKGKSVKEKKTSPGRKGKASAGGSQARNTPRATVDKVRSKIDARKIRTVPGYIY